MHTIRACAIYLKSNNRVLKLHLSDLRNRGSSVKTFSSTSKEQFHARDYLRYLFGWLRLFYFEQQSPSALHRFSSFRRLFEYNINKKQPECNNAMQSEKRPPKMTLFWHDGDTQGDPVIVKLDFPCKPDRKYIMEYKQFTYVLSSTLKNNSEDLSEQYFRNCFELSRSWKIIVTSSFSKPF